MPASSVSIYILNAKSFHRYLMSVLKTKTVPTLLGSRTFFKTLTQDAFEAMAMHCHVQVALLSFNDALYLPSGCIVLEKVTSV